MKKSKVAVCLITYNHAHFVREALEGIMMQETNFDWMVHVADDCSTDETRAIILEYQQKQPDKFHLIFKDKNVGPIQNWFNLIGSTNAEYIAYCEGDDYWTDPLKLQKQVDYLDANANVVACFTNSRFIKADGTLVREIYNPKANSNEFYDQEKCLTFLRSSYPTCTLMYRSIKLEEIPKSLMPKFCDELLDLVLTERGVIHCMKDTTANYRFHDKGEWNKNSELKKHIELFERTEVMYNTEFLRKKYKKQLNQRYFDLIQALVVNDEISNSKRRFYFFKTVSHLDYLLPGTYKLILNFLLKSLQHIGK